MTNSRVLISFLLILAESAYAQKLKVGDSAPTFEVEDAYGKEVKISEEPGQKIFLAFMRYVSCPVCNYRFHEMTENYNTLREAGYKLIVVYQSENEQLKEYLTSNTVPFQVVGDPDRSLYKLYGLKRSTWKMIGSIFNKEFREHRKKGNELYGENEYDRDGARNGLPADFIISQEGKVIRAYYGKTVSDHLPLNELIEKK